MVSNQTQHLKLCQWESDDEVLRVDFNADNAKIDIAVAGVEQKLSIATAEAQRKLETAVASVEQKLNVAADTAQMALEKARAGYGPENLPFVVGTYTGNADYGVTDGARGQTIRLGFAPRYVQILDLYAYTDNGSYTPNMGYYAGGTIRGQPLASNGYTCLELTEDGFMACSPIKNRIQAYPRLNDMGRTYAYVAFR